MIILGGDRREIELYRYWSGENLAVKLAGFESAPDLTGGELAGEEDFRKIDVLIAPLSGIKGDGYINARFAPAPLSVFTYLEKPLHRVVLIAGLVERRLQAALAEKADIILAADDQELALLNAIPTAEGAVQKAMEMSDITLHGSRVLILGLGRCGTVLARVLQGLGARVEAVVRRRDAAAVAVTMGIKAIYIEQIAEAVQSADFIFNTVPAPVLNAAVLQKANRDCLILDLASAPGGTDFDAAGKLGVKAVLLPGLPGLAAPRTAAKILARVYGRMLSEKFTGMKK